MCNINISTVRLSARDLGGEVEMARGGTERRVMFTQLPRNNSFTETRMGT